MTVAIIIAIVGVFVMCIYHKMCIGGLQDSIKIEEEINRNARSDFLANLKESRELKEEFVRFKTMTQKNIAILVKKVNSQMATSKDLIDKMNILKPLVDALNEKAKNTQNGLDMANLQVAGLTEKVNSAVSDQDSLDFAAAMIDEMVTSLSLPVDIQR